MGIPKRLTRAEAAERNGRRLLDAARQVFVERGYHAATLDEVARAAGFTKGVVYARYASKSELFLALVEERIAARIADLEALEDADLEAALWRQQRQRLPAERDWLLVVTEFRVAAARDPEVNARYAALHERLVAATAAAIERATAQTGRALGVSATEAARLILALASGMLIERVGSGERFPERLSVTGSERLLAGMATAARRRSAS